MTLLARRYCQYGSLPKISLEINDPEQNLIPRTQNRRFKSRDQSRSSLSVPESDHLPQHNAERCENSRRERDGPSQVLRSALPKIHGLHVHADPCNNKTNDNSVSVEDECNIACMSDHTQYPEIACIHIQFILFTS